MTKIYIKSDRYVGTYYIVLFLCLFENVHNLKKNFSNLKQRLLFPKTEPCKDTLVHPLVGEGHVESGPVGVLISGSSMGLSLKKSITYVIEPD